HNIVRLPYLPAVYESRLLGGQLFGRINIVRLRRLLGGHIYGRIDDDPPTCAGDSSHDQEQKS
ncbi:MAG: hypothetical protein WCP21_09205, partial [Armatimonadota bacterium]